MVPQETENGGLSAAAVEQTTNNVMADPVYSRADLSDTESAQNLFDLLREWFNDLGAWSLSSPDQARVVIYVLVFLLLAIFAHLVYTVVSEFHLKPKIAAARRKKNTVVALEGEADDWDDAVAQAQAAKGRGDYHRALWIMHRLFLGVLDTRQVIRFARWKTNTDYLEEALTARDDHKLLAQLTQAYEQVVYGHQEIDAHQVDGLLSRLTQARSM